MKRVMWYTISIATNTCCLNTQTFPVILHKKISQKNLVWKGPPDVNYPNPLLWADPVTSGCSELYPVEFWVSQDTEPVGNLFQCLITFTVKMFFLKYAVAYMGANVWNFLSE